jgi:hypothetical protein
VHPTRRRYLRYAGGAVLTTGVAGCSGDADETRPAGTGGPGVTITATDTDVDLPIRPAVELVRDAATPDRPPGLRTTLTNTGDETVTVGEGRAAHFEYVTADSGLLILLPAEGEYPADPDCWRLTETVATTEEYRTFDLDPDASRARPVDLYATPDADGCLPVGKHRFETTVSVVTADADPEASATWGFSVVLE